MDIGTIIAFAGAIIVAALLLRARLRASRAARENGEDLPGFARGLGITASLAAFAIAGVLLLRAAPDDPNSTVVREAEDCRVIQRMLMMEAIHRGDMREATRASEALARCARWRSTWDGTQMALAGGAALAGVVVLLLTAMIPGAPRVALGAGSVTLSTAELARRMEQERADAARYEGKQITAAEARQRVERKLGDPSHG